MESALLVFVKRTNVSSDSMNKKPNPNLIDDDNPEWTEADFKRARPASEILPPDLLAGLVSIKKQRGERGPQKTQIKDPVTMPLSHEVVEQFKSTGRGWQTRIDAALKEWLSTNRV